MKVEDPIALLEAIERKTEQNTALYDAISRIAPAMRTVEFHSAEEFRERLKPILLEWLPRLSGSSSHVRLRRRGDGHDLRTPDTERFCDAFSSRQRRRQVRRVEFPLRTRMR